MIYFFIYSQLNVTSSKTLNKNNKVIVTSKLSPIKIFKNMGENW